MIQIVYGMILITLIMIRNQYGNKTRHEEQWW